MDASDRVSAMLQPLWKVTCPALQLVVPRLWTAICALMLGAAMAGAQSAAPAADSNVARSFIPTEAAEKIAALRGEIAHHDALYLNGRRESPAG
jgi:hypothetical protein